MFVSRVSKYVGKYLAGIISSYLKKREERGKKVLRRETAGGNHPLMKASLTRDAKL